MMIHEGGGRVGCFFIEGLLEQWLQLPVVIEEYPYVVWISREILRCPDLLVRLGMSWYVCLIFLCLYLCIV